MGNSNPEWKRKVGGNCEEAGTQRGLWWWGSQDPEESGDRENLLCDCGGRGVK